MIMFLLTNYKEFSESVESNVVKEIIIRILCVWRGLSSNGMFIITRETIAFL